MVDLPIKLVIFDDFSISFHHETCPNGHQPWPPQPWPAKRRAVQQSLWPVIILASYQKTTGLSSFIMVYQALLWFIMV